MVELNNNVIVDIDDLPKDIYEYFLELINQLRLAYIVIKQRNNDIKT